ARADVWRQRNHVQVPGLLTCVWVVIRPTAVITRQRDQAELAVESCSVSVVPAKPAAVVAKPSRLYVTAVTLLSAMKVSGVVPVKAPCTRSTPAALFRSENTIQPFAQSWSPVQEAPSLETQAVTGWPSRIASARAYCRSPRSPLTSADMR